MKKKMSTTLMVSKQTTGKKILFYLIAILLMSHTTTKMVQAKSYNEVGKNIWVATAYDNDFLCTGKHSYDKNYGITASGKPANNGTIACNWLPFGTVLYVDGKRCVVQDRGAKSIFGDKQHHIKRLDIWMPTHKQALQYGRRTVNVVIAD